MVIARSSARAPCLAGLVSLCLFGSLGCTRASVAALLPSLSLAVAAQRSGRAEAGAEHGATQRWDAIALVSLQFRPRSIAMELPARGELAPETWIAPCDSDDFICLQEAADAEQELNQAFGELQ